MTPLLILWTVSLVGIEAGWEPLPEGGHLYTVQIEPELVRQLEQRHDLVSDVPANIQVRRLRITVGNRALARVDAAPAVAAPTDPAAGAAMPAHFDQPSAEAQPLVDLPPPPTIGNETQQTETQQPASPHAASPPSTDAQARSTEKPRIDSDAVGTETSRPWLPFLVALVLLACSLGANLYLGWLVRDARTRYRSAVSRVRPASAG